MAIVVAKDGNGGIAYFDITLSNGGTFTLTVSERSQLAYRQMTINLCSTWNIKNLQIRIDLQGRKIFSKSYFNIGHDIMSAINSWTNVFKCLISILPSNTATAYVVE